MNLLFWSGGKDSYLCCEMLRRESDRPIQLLTTYEEERDIVPHHNISLETIQEQARQLDLELTICGLPPECPNEVYIDRLKDTFSKITEPIDHLVFGDWKNREIREWREKIFEQQLGYSCLFPIWEKSLHDLMPILLLKPVKVKISAVQEAYRDMLSVGEPWNQRLVAQLPESIDPMGENGEFHTVVEFQSLTSFGDG